MGTPTVQPRAIEHSRKLDGSIVIGLTIIKYCENRGGWIFPTGEVERDRKKAGQMAIRFHNRNYPLRWKLKNG